jgi:probable HAF family extracellular repeat protein
MDTRNKTLAVPAMLQASYRLVQLSTDRYTTGVINAWGQVAFTESSGDIFRAKFYDGSAVRDLGTLGGPTATAAALNNRGQVVGQSRIDPGTAFNHAYIWSESMGMVDLHRPGEEQLDSYATDINNRGQVTGTAGTTPFRWSARTGMEDLLTFGLGGGANALNNAGTVVGFASIIDADDNPQGLPARWTAPARILVLAPAGTRTTGARGINAGGDIVGSYAPDPAGAEHAFLWTPGGGLLDLGTGSGNFSGAFAINNRGMVIGAISALPDFQRGFVWTRDTGMIEIGTAGVAMSNTAGLNRRGQVVGAIEGRAYVWTLSGGIVDLNTRVPGAPAGLVLVQASAISDNGSIVASASNGLYLLVPHWGME